VELPKGVHRVTARGREYLYYHPGRGTGHAGERIRLPSDMQSPEFWQALRQAQGIISAMAVDTVNALIDDYLASPKFLGIAKQTQYHYRRSLNIAREAWGALPAKQLRPVHVQAMMDTLTDTPAKANAFLLIMRVLSGWGRARDRLDASLVEGVEKFKGGGGHKPWTPEQIDAAHTKLVGTVRRGILLELYTGQRGSDVVRLGPTYIDDGGFNLSQRKTGRQVWCPIVPELANEMATWERQPGPFLRQRNGKPFTAKSFWRDYDAQRKNIPELIGTTIHGLRCTAVIRLRQAGLSVGQIGDITGMSLATIQRYCRFADMKAGGQAALLSLNCKTTEKL
jgi:integrase